MSTKRICLSLFLLVYCLNVQSAYPQKADAPERAEFDHLTLHVANLDRSVEFYRGVIGLEQVPDPFKNGTVVFLRLSAHSQLHLVGGGQVDMQRDISVHFAVRVPSLDSFRARLQQKHIKYFSSEKEEGVVTTRPDGIKQIYFQDPDGYWVEANDSRL